jgi:Smr domain
MASLKTINLEAGMPTVEKARHRLAEELRRARAAGVPAIKVIHGYGSTGVGGALRTGVRKSLLLRRKEGLVAEIVFGERWDIFDPVTQEVLTALPELRRDSDLQRCNPGITIVLMRSLGLST